MDNIMSLLPNDIIMQIIRTADGGRNTHKKKLLPMLQRELQEDESWGCLKNVFSVGAQLEFDDLAAFMCDRREHYDSDEEYMHMVRNPEEYC